MSRPFVAIGFILFALAFTLSSDQPSPLYGLSFRFKNQNIKKVIVYASSPVQKVIGEFEIDQIINLELNALWEKTSRHSGISEDYFYQYFGDKEQGYAIKIKKVKKYKQPMCIKADFKLTPPQSFAYVVRT